jgi:Ca2+-binding RTX toxin-like protein
MSLRPTLLTPLAVSLLVVGPLAVPPASGAAGLSCQGRRVTITDTGTPGEVVRGTDRSDVIAVSDPATPVFAGGGDDLVCGSSWVQGGPGDDRIRMGRPTDYVPDLNGDAGDDRIVVDNGLVAHLRGGAGDDRLLATGGRQFLVGGEGRDVLSGGRGDDLLSGGAGVDSLRGGPGDDDLSGGTERDVLEGQSGADVLRGGKGRDDVAGGEGDDELHGGPGNDYVGGWGGTDEGWGGDGSDECSVSTEVRHGCELVDPTT